MPDFGRKVDEDLQGVGPGTGMWRFVMNGPTRGFEPIQITG